MAKFSLKNLQILGCSSVQLEVKNVNLFMVSMRFVFQYVRYRFLFKGLVSLHNDWTIGSEDGWELDLWPSLKVLGNGLNMKFVEKVDLVKEECLVLVLFFGLRRRD